MLETYLNFTNKLAQICGIFAAGCLLASIVLITELVFERYLFQNAITWQPELVTMMLVASTFIGAPYVLKEGGHVNMEYVYTLIDEKKKTFLQIFTSIICLLFFMVLFYLAWEITYEAWVKKYTTNSIWDPPLWIPYSSMLIGATLMTLQYIGEVLRLIVKYKGFQ